MFTKRRHSITGETHWLPWLARRLRWPIAILALAFVYGVLGYTILEGWNIMDAVFMTVITLSTAAYGEVNKLDTSGRIFTISLILFGLAAVLAAVAALSDALVGGELGALVRRRRMQKRIESLNKHFIICAFGRVGRSAAEEFIEQRVPVVAIERVAELGPLMDEANIPYIIGDPTQDSVLKEAGIERALGLVCAVDSDATNVYITLTARAMNPGLHIVARASQPESVDKLLRAGADRVVSPYDISGRRMASMAVRPSVVEFVDMVTVAPDLRLEEIVIGAGSHLEGRSVGQATATHPGVFILALKKPDAPLEPSPRQDTILSEGDLVIAMGPVVSLNHMAT